MFPKYQDWELVFLPPIKSSHKTDLKGLLSNVFVGKFLEVFLLYYCLYCYKRKFFRGVSEKFQFEKAMGFQSLGIKYIMSLYILSWLTLERPSFFKSHRV